ncbi:MAG: GH3 auxin-responsive promoter family protein [Bacteroidota bacterium]
MSLLGSLLKSGLAMRRNAVMARRDDFRAQRRVLKKLLRTAMLTEFGEKYAFRDILHAFHVKDKHIFYEEYKRRVPIFDYNRMDKEWWNRSRRGIPDVAWPGKVRYFALSSGTSEASTKHIPETIDMIRAIQKTSIRQILTLPQYDMPARLFSRGILLLGGSTSLKNNGNFYEGDLSGIQASRLPLWFRQFYKPGKKIALTPDWDKKLDEITLHAKEWNIGYIAGVPAWVQMLMERIITHYGVKNIHEIWPDLTVYCHGGVSFEPYRKSFEKLCGKPLIYLETYLASEGFIAYQYRKDHDMRLVTDNGLFFEFVPFTDDNFTPDGDLVDKPEVLMIDEAVEGKDYALLLSTCAGAWRYLIGDVIRFTHKSEAEIVITGRTKHFLSLCGEHLSVENMNKAVGIAGEKFNLNIKEFAVAGKPFGTMFEHEWYLGVDNITGTEDPIAIRNLVDESLKVLNDDYRTERSGPLKEVRLHVLPVSIFYRFMKKIGKEGGQNKFPRVLKKQQLELWDAFIAEHAPIAAATPLNSPSA